jgi:hypothetical protein
MDRFWLLAHTTQKLTRFFPPPPPATGIENVRPPASTTPMATPPPQAMKAAAARQDAMSLHGPVLVARAHDAKADAVLPARLGSILLLPSALSSTSWLTLLTVC